jgi:hypothetical protein
MFYCSILTIILTIYSTNAFFHIVPMTTIRNIPIETKSNYIRNTVTEHFLHLYNITLDVSWDSGEIPWEITHDDCDYFF